MELTDKLTAIADAIRGKTGGTEKLTMDQMVEEIDGISAGGPLQAKTVCPNHLEQVIAPDEGYYGLDVVTVYGDENLTAENIKYGVKIFGVEGCCVGNGTAFASVARGMLPTVYKGTATSVVSSVNGFETSATGVVSE